MVCAQGTPTFWPRTWNVSYRGGEFRYEIPGGTSLSASWSAPASAQEGPEDAVFEQATTDGRTATITVDRNGTILGSAVVGGDGMDIRCGAAVEQAAVEEPLPVEMVCSIARVSQPFPTTLTVNRSLFPWRSVAGNEELLITDPQGALAGPETLANWSDGGVQVRIGGTAEFDATYYRFAANGDLVEVERPSRHAGLGSTICKR